MTSVSSPRVNASTSARSWRAAPSTSTPDGTSPSRNRREVRPLPSQRDVCRWGRIPADLRTSVAENYVAENYGELYGMEPRRLRGRPLVWSHRGTGAEALRAAIRCCGDPSRSASPCGASPTDPGRESPARATCPARSVDRLIRRRQSRQCARGFPQPPSPEVASRAGSW